MISEIDLLLEDIPRLERKFGANNPFVAVLKAHLKALQDQAKPQPRTAPYYRRLINFLRLQNRSKKERSGTLDHNE
ncbi:MAG: hypothetical protein ACR65R_07440 [Methylomicrobium sp.]